MVACTSASSTSPGSPEMTEIYILKKKKKLETREFVRTSEHRADGAESTAQVSQDEGRISPRSLREGPMSDSAHKRKGPFRPLSQVVSTKVNALKNCLQKSRGHREPFLMPPCNRVTAGSTLVLMPETCPLKKACASGRAPCLQLLGQERK